MLKSKDTIVVEQGDEVVIETAGGGGYGPPERREEGKIVEDYENELITLEEIEKVYGKHKLALKLASDRRG